MGGKNLSKYKIIDQFPKNYEDYIYLEPFVGGGNIILSKNPSKEDIINDIDKDLITVFKGFKNYDDEKISNAINGVYNKKDFLELKNNPDSKDKFENFIKKFLIFRLSFYGKGKIYSSHRGDSETVNYRGKNHEKLKNVKIYNTDYENLLKKYNRSNVFVYMDPPYEGSSSEHYKYHDFDYDKLKKNIDSFKGKFLLSVNDSPNIKNLFKDYNITHMDTKYAKGQQGGQHNIKKELLIKNY